MIEELLHWPVKNRNLRNIGRKVEDINKEFHLLDMSLNDIDNSVPNMYRARSLMKKIGGTLS